MRIARGILLFFALLATLLAAIPGLSGNTWWIRYLDFPRLEFMIAGLLIWLALASLPRTWLSWAALVFLGAAVAYNAKVLFPYTTLEQPQQLAADTCADGQRLRLLEANVQMTNQHDHRLLQMVRQTAPDIAWFQEIDDWWAQELSPLSDSMPNRVVKTQPNYFGAALYSRLPLIDPHVHDLTGSANPSVFTGVRLPSGSTIRFYGIHPRPPQVGQSTTERNAQLAATALAANDDTAPHVVAGDMNAVPWEGIIHQTERIGHLLDPRVGRGLYITWNAEDPILKWPLDQILPGPRFTLLNLRVLPEFGSDHRPYLADLCLEPDAASRQPPPKPRPDDLEAALVTVQAGQHKADRTGNKGRGNGDEDIE